MEPDETHQIPDPELIISSDVAFQWPRQAQQAGNWSIAASRWKILRSIYPDHHEAWFHACRAHLHANELIEAQALLDQAHQRFPSNPRYFIEQSQIDIQKKNWESASRNLEQARKAAPNYPLAWIQSASLAKMRGDLENATKFALQATRCAPDQQDPLISYAELAMENEQYEQALERWEALRDRFPNNPLGYTQAIIAAQILGKEDAVQDLQLAQIARRTPKNTSAQTHPQKPNQSTDSPPVHMIALIWTKAIYNLRSDVRRNYLSFGWWILEPLMHMVVYQIVFGMLLDRGGPNYLMFLMIGVVPWMWVMKSISSSSGSVLNGQVLMLQVGVHPVFFPMVNFVQATIKQIPVYALLIGFVLLNGSSPGIHWLYLVPVILVQALFTIAISLAIAAIIPFVRDLQQIVPTGLTLLMFLSGIFYDYHTLDQKWHLFFALNPVAFILDCYRTIFIDAKPPDIVLLTIHGTLYTALCMMLIFLYNKLRYVYPRVVLE